MGPPQSRTSRVPSSQSRDVSRTASISDSPSSGEGILMSSLFAVPPTSEFLGDDLSSRPVEPGRHSGHRDAFCAVWNEPASHIWPHDSHVVMLAVGPVALKKAHSKPSTPPKAAHARTEAILLTSYLTILAVTTRVYTFSCMGRRALFDSQALDVSPLRSVCRHAEVPKASRPLLYLASYPGPINSAGGVESALFGVWNVAFETWSQ